MDSLNTLRAVLVGVTFVLAIMLAFDGRWMPAGLLGLGILAHFGLWAHLQKERRQHAARASSLDGTAPPPQP